MSRWQSGWPSSSPKALAVKLWLPSQDVVSRLLRLSFSNATSFSIKDVILNLGGLLIGAVETTSHTVVNSVEFLLVPEGLAA